jgi:hypothetical protein
MGNLSLEAPFWHRDARDCHRRAAGFGLMMLAARQVLVGDGLVSPLWITGSLLLLTLGEMRLSPWASPP